MEYLWASPSYRWTDLLNSDSHDYRGSGRREDRIENDDWLGPFLKLCGFERGRTLDSEERKALRKLRTDLAKIVASLIAGDYPKDKDLRILNQYLRFAEARPLLELSDRVFQLREERGRAGIEGLLGYLARNFAETLAFGELDRIKICANPDCHWVMYDESKNKTRRWCEANACGNLMKVREFRERRAKRRQGAG